MGFIINYKFILALELELGGGEYSPNIDLGKNVQFFLFCAKKNSEFLLIRVGQEIASFPRNFF